MEIERRNIRGLKVTYPLYHITEEERVESIMEHGLLPADELEELDYDSLFPYSDSSYVYLFNATSMSESLKDTSSDWLQSKKVLEVKILEDHQLEREYEQATITLKLSGEKLNYFLKNRQEHTDRELNKAEDYVEYYFDEVYGIDYTGPFTVDEVIEFIDEEISDEEWNEKDGKYRTEMQIEPQYLKVIDDLSVFK